MGAGPPYLINEYGWLWINRDGTLPTLTVDVYKRILGEDASTDARRLYYARMLAAKTEFWRVRRQCCGVLHFCGLGYSRPDGQTSDNFIDVQNLTYEPHFFQYVRDAFAPVGVAIDFWEDRLPKGSTACVPVRVINDLNTAWSGDIVLRLMHGDRVLSDKRQAVRAEALELGSAEFDVSFPAEESDVQLIAEIRSADGQPVRSLRDIQIREVAQSLSLGRPVKASSEFRNAQGFFPAALSGRRSRRHALVVRIRRQPMAGSRSRSRNDYLGGNSYMGASPWPCLRHRSLGRRHRVERSLEDRQRSRRRRRHPLRSRRSPPHPPPRRPPRYRVRLFPVGSRGLRTE